MQAELEASIADAIESRIEHGEVATEAERAVLTDLGNPGTLAAGYTDRSLYVIGPRYFLTWWRLLKLLWGIVPVVAMAGAALGQILAGAPVGSIIGDSLSTGHRKHLRPAGLGR